MPEEREPAIVGVAMLTAARQARPGDVPAPGVLDVHAPTAMASSSSFDASDGRTRVFEHETVRLNP